MFNQAIDDLFADPNLARDALWRAGGTGPGQPVRVIPRRPDRIASFGETRLHAEAAVFELRASEVASPRPGDTLEFEGATYVVQGEPRRDDPDRLVWTLDARPA